MKPQLLAGLLLLLACTLSVRADKAAKVPAASPAPAPAAPTRCGEFELGDQYDKVHRYGLPLAKLTVLTVADRQGADHIAAWAQPLGERYQDRIAIDGLADVSNVPGPLRSMVQSKFKKRIPHPVMLDWHGDATRAFAYEKQKANLYVIARDGRILLHLAGEADEARLQQVYAVVDRELAAAPRSPVATAPALPATPAK